MGEPSMGVYRLPQQGERVQISGVRCRPQLNGARGEVLRSSTDKNGRVAVRIFDKGSESVKMMIHPGRLQPVGSASMPELPGCSPGGQPLRQMGSTGGPFGNRSVSRQSEVSGRSLSSAIGTSGAALAGL